VPIYEYRCTVCGHTFEAIQKISDTPVAECEVCGEPVVKVLHPAAIHFKGSGFYTTDYGRSSGKARGGGGGDDGKKSASDKPADKQSDAPSAKSGNGSGTGSGPAKVKETSG
jgi:putative FmdB family regulatory protein